MNQVITYIFFDNFVCFLRQMKKIIISRASITLILV